MLLIDLDTLRMLSAQSKIKIEEKDEEMWIKDLNHWLVFFSLESFSSKGVGITEKDLTINTVDAGSSSLCTRNSSLREDVVSPGLSLSQVRSLSVYFRDGFFVFPMQTVYSTKENKEVSEAVHAD